ncbi:MAG TPA: baseplate J/gp47 family protein, partial [Actinomycetota bacterium]
MAGRVIYLDVDDELTSAAARIRSVEGGRVAVVLPYGSRVATSRINFRLLARDAQANGKRLAVVAGDAATRALAASAGLPIFATIAEYESADDGDAESEPEGGAPAGRGAAPPVPPAVAQDREAGDADAEPDDEAIEPDDEASEPDDDAIEPDDEAAPPPVDDAAIAALGLAASATVVDPAAADEAPGPDARRGRDDTSTARTPRRVPSAVPAERVVRDTTSDHVDARRERDRGRDRDPGRDRDRARATARAGDGGTSRLLALAVLALAVLVGGVGAYLLLPSATAVITPRETTIGPIPLRIVASTAATAPDPEARLVPAVEKTFELEAGQRFPVTGKRIEEAPATGAVRFRNKDFTSTEGIPKGSIVSTQGGIRFATDKAVTVPRAELVGLQIFPASATVTVTAVEPGPEGNVEPNTILVIPRGEDPLTLDVTNPDATSGGTRDEFPRITQEDVDAAVATLTTDLQTALDDRLDDPDLVADGTTVFPETAQLGTPEYSVELSTLVGQEVDGFDLAATAGGTVLAVDEAPVRTVAEGNIAASVEPGYALVEGSSEVATAPAEIQDGVVTFPVVVTALQVLQFDTAAIEAEIL